MIQLIFIVPQLFFLFINNVYVKILHILLNYYQRVNCILF